MSFYKILYKIVYNISRSLEYSRRDCSKAGLFGMIFYVLIILPQSLFITWFESKLKKRVEKEEKQNTTIKNYEKYFSQNRINNTQNFNYNKSDDYEKQAISYYNEATCSGYKKALDLFSKAILSSTKVKHSLYYYRANTHLKLNILNNALDDINTALKYLDEQDTENITKYLYTKGLIIQNTGSKEDIIDFWNYLISFSEYKCNDCGKIQNKNLSYCDCGSNNFSFIENEYINNAKKMLEDIKGKSTNDYIQKIHNIVFNKRSAIVQSVYNTFFALYIKKKLEIAEENYELGLKEFYKENFIKAKEYFESAVSLAPYNKEYRDCLKQIKNEESKIVADDKITLGIEELNNGNANKAIKYLDEAINLYECSKYFFLRGKAYLSQGISYYDKAIYNFNKAISLEADNSEYYYNGGKAHLLRYKYDEALEYFNKAIELKSNDWEYYYNRGLANYEIGNYADSIDDYSNAISLNYEILNNEDISYNIKTSINKVESISSKNEKIKYIKALITKGNEYVDIGCDYLEKNDYNTAIEYFNKAIEINPNYKFAYINRATAYAKLKKYQNALNDYNKVIDLDPYWTDAYHFRSLTYYDMNLYNEAISDCNTLIEFNALDPQAYYVRGVVYLMDNEQSFAIKDFISACIIDKSYIDIISENANINLMSIMNIVSDKLPDNLSEKEIIYVIQFIQEMSDEDLGLNNHSQNNELSNDTLSVIKSSIRKIDI